MDEHHVKRLCETITALSDAATGLSMVMAELTKAKDEQRKVSPSPFAHHLRIVQKSLDYALTKVNVLVDHRDWAPSDKLGKEQVEDLRRFNG